MAGWESFKEGSSYKDIITIIIIIIIINHNLKIKNYFSYFTDAKLLTISI